jgi:hypothetical protein
VIRRARDRVFDPGAALTRSLEWPQIIVIHAGSERQRVLNTCLDHGFRADLADLEDR